MNIAFFSNYLNHHQLPFCLAMDRLTGGHFTFVATTPISQERLKLGYREMDHQYPFVLTTYDSVENESKAMELALSADAIIIGSAPNQYAEERVKQGKLTFRYSERPYKQGVPFSQIPHQLASNWLHYGRFSRKPYYMLCASNFTAYDFGLFGAFRNKCYKWGYFPEVKKENLDKLFRERQERQKVILLWVARLIPLKHPEMAIRLAEFLKSEQYDFELQIIGNGKLEEPLCRMIREKHLEDCVFMLGSMSPEAVREHMAAADVFLFTSDFKEGWGAVLNESMNSACAVIASHAIGSVGFLVENGKNGLIYRNEDQEDLNRNVKYLLDHPEKMKQLGSEAYHTLTDLWNADIAAHRLLKLVEYLESGGKGSPFTVGPCSVAERISNQKAGKLLLGR